jgi:hypothetical protein
MPIQLWAALIGAAGALAGVATGTFLTGWYQRQAWMRDQTAKSRADRTEISLLGQPPVIRAAREVTRSHIRLAEGRAFHRAGSLPDATVADCRHAENAFIHAARAELDVAGSEAELDDAFRHVDSDPVNPPR